MNSVTLSGVVAGDSEQLEISSGRRLLLFDLHVEGPPHQDPCIRIGYFLGDGAPLELKAETRVLVTGRLRHRRDTGIFCAAREILFLASRSEDANATR